jgi:putative sterol carrier protein
MASPTDSFFDELNRRGHEPAFRNRTATIRFDVMHGKNTDRWIVAIDKGDLTVSRSDGPADCVLRGDRSLFDAFVTGRADPMAAMLRGELLADGDAELLVAARRLMPATSGTESAS